MFPVIAMKCVHVITARRGVQKIVLYIVIIIIIVVVITVLKIYCS